MTLVASPGISLGVFGMDSGRGPVAGQPDTDAADAQALTELRRTVAQVGQLSVNVQEGRVTLDPAAGAQLLSSLRTHSEEIAGWQSQVGELSGSLPLGQNPVAESMGIKFSHRADGDETSLAAVLAQYQTAITDATSAIEQAMQRYADNETTIGDSFRRISAS